MLHPLFSSPTVSGSREGGFGCAKKILRQDYTELYFIIIIANSVFVRIFAH